MDLKRYTVVGQYEFTNAAGDDFFVHFVEAPDPRAAALKAVQEWADGSLMYAAEALEQAAAEIRQFCRQVAADGGRYGSPSRRERKECRKLSPNPPAGPGVGRGGGGRWGPGPSGERRGAASRPRGGVAEEAGFDRRRATSPRSRAVPRQELPPQLPRHRPGRTEGGGRAAAARVLARQRRGVEAVGAAWNQGRATAPCPLCWR